MKNVIAVIICLLVGFSTTMAQKKSKEEIALEKEWAKKLKALKPMEYKSLVEEVEEKQGLELTLTEERHRADKMMAEIEPLKSKLASCDAELTDAVSKMNTMEQSKLDEEKAKLTAKPSAAAKSGNTATRSSAPVPGLVYKVQIGAFKKKDLTKYFDSGGSFSGEVDADGTKKYTLGEFADYWEADKFKKYLRDMGVKDAWVVAYKDGQRVNMKDAREGVL